MTVRRTAAVAAAAGFVAAVGVWPVAPAQAHGAPTNPVSRASVCSVASATEGLPVCVAALTANGLPFGNFDNLRVPGVAGQDKQFIPDGQLCSASLPEFKGLDLPRADWPATTLTAGGTLRMRYRATIPHRGSFRLYLTRPGWQPTQALRWQDLDADPFVTVADPPLTGGAYQISGRLPADRTGRHLLYTVWQTSDTPDTYYSCSDVVLKASGAAAGGAGTAPKPSASAPGPRTQAGKPGGGRTVKPLSSAVPTASGLVLDDPVTGGGADAAAAPPQALSNESWLGPAEPILGDRIALGQQIMSAALVVIVGVTAGLGFMRLRAARAADGIHRRIRP